MKAFNQPSNYLLIGVLGTILGGALLYKHYQSNDRNVPSTIKKAVPRLEDKVKDSYAPAKELVSDRDH